MAGDATFDTLRAWRRRWLLAQGDEALEAILETVTAIVGKEADEMSATPILDGQRKRFAYTRAGKPIPNGSGFPAESESDDARWALRLSAKRTLPLRAACRLSAHARSPVAARCARVTG